MIRKKNYNVVLQISVNGEIHNVLTLYGSQEDQKNPNQEWRVDSYQTGVEVGDPNDPDNTNSDNTTEPGNGGGHDSLPGGDDWGGGNDVTYTKEELKAMIAEKETDLADLRLDLREAKLEYDTMEKEVKDGTITAVINGIVKEVRDPDEASAEGSAVVTVSSEGNLYVKGTVDEFSYGSLKKGAVVTANSWETGNTFEAKVTEISPYPVGNANYSGYGTGNPNVSYYPFTAVIEDPPEEISNGESVTLSFNKNEAVNTEGAIYLPLAYVRTENNKSYVYVQGKDKKLEKRYITTGQTLYNYVIEIKSGIKSSDSIAFPYGKIVKEGAKTKTADDESDIVY